MKFTVPLLLLSSLAQEAKPPVPEEEQKPSITLPAIGTAFPLRQQKGRREIEVDGKGKIFVEGKEVTREALAKTLADDSLRPASRDPKTPPPVRAVLLRIDRELPWPAAQRLVWMCMDPKVRVYRIQFAVHPEGAEDAAAVAASPPILETPGGGEFTTVPVKLEYDETEIPVTPSDIYPFLEKKHPELEGKRTLFEIDAAPSVPTGDVLAAADTVLRWGATAVTIRPDRRPAGKDLAAWVAALPARRGGLVLTVMGTRVLPPGKDAATLPPVEVPKEGAAAGRDSPFIGVGSEEEEVEIEPEPGEKPGEREPPVEKPRK